MKKTTRRAEPKPTVVSTEPASQQHLDDMVLEHRASILRDLSILVGLKDEVVADVNSAWGIRDLLCRNSHRTAVKWFMAVNALEVLATLFGKKREDEYMTETELTHIAGLLVNDLDTRLAFAKDVTDEQLLGLEKFIVADLLRWTSLDGTEAAAKHEAKLSVYNEIRFALSDIHNLREHSYDVITYSDGRTSMIRK